LGGPTGRLQAAILPAGDPFRPIFSDVIDATIVAAALIEGIVLPDIAEASWIFNGLAPQEYGRVPKSGTRNGVDSA
jgi:hypothetical protein